MFTSVQDTIDNVLYSEIKESNVHGLGLFSTHVIPEGEVISVLGGQVVAWALFNVYDQKMEWNAISQTELLVRPFRTKYAFINHSRNPNLIIKHDPLRLVTRHEIQPGDELLLDYRNEPLPAEYIDKKGRHYL